MAAARHRAPDEDAAAPGGAAPVARPGGATAEARPGGPVRDARPGVDLERLTEGWLRRWPACPPLGAALPGRYPDRSLRLRGPARAAAATGAGLPPAYRTMLSRYNTLLDRLFGRRDVYVVAGAYADLSAAATTPEWLTGLNPGAVHWLRLLGRDERAYHDRALDLYVARRPWQAGCLDPLLLGAALARVANTMIMDVDLYRIVHPNRDGADLIAIDPAEREELRLDYATWVDPTHAGNTN